VRELAALRADGYVPQSPADVYAGVLAFFRTLTTPEQWAHFRAALLDSLLPAELELAGLWKDGALRLPEEQPLIILPKRGPDGSLTGLRFKPLKQTGKP
jgi:hypothetical protein